MAVLAIDQGSGSTKALLVAPDGTVIARGVADVTTSHPKPGWVQQDALHLWQTVRDAVAAALANAGDVQVDAIGLSTQRESLVVWDGRTGTPLAPVLTWQDRRSAALMPRLAHAAAEIRTITGLPLDPMFSALKAATVLPEVSRDADVRIGTIDSWLLWNLGAGHVIEIGNASRTQLLDVRTGNWSANLAGFFNVPQSALPTVVMSDAVHRLAGGALPGIAAGTPISGVLGDSHAALFAHAGWLPGRVKATYGTGSSVMALGAAADAASGLCTTIAWGDATGVHNALEGNILSSGSTLVWLAELLKVSVAELADVAGPSTGDVALVPAFNGLGAPWWDERAQGIITGLTLGTSIADLASAGLDSIAMQVTDIVDAIRAAGVDVAQLRADGGATRNGELMQRQADFAGADVAVSSVAELSALGAATFAGRTIGLWDADELARRAVTDHSYSPAIAADVRASRRAGWHNAVARARLTTGS